MADVSPWALLALAYLLGMVPSGRWLVRWRHGADIERLGSGNIGATNVYRSFGAPLGLLTLAIDSGKGWLACRLVERAGVASPWSDLAPVVVVLGHCFPLLGRRRGGKGVATAAGALAAGAPEVLLPALALFLVVLWWRRRVSLASILAALSIVPFALLAGQPPVFLGAWGLATLLILWRHQGNLERLRQGIEPPLGRRPQSGSHGRAVLEDEPD